MSDNRFSSRAIRLLDFAGYLALRNRLTTRQQVADVFQISTRTVSRDVIDLRAMGLPIDGEAGSGYLLSKDQFVEWFLAKTLRNPRAGRERPNYAERRIAAAMEVART